MAPWSKMTISILHSSHSKGIYRENEHVKLILKKRHSAKSEDIYHTQAV